jgi:hypothetical protein
VLWILGVYKDREVMANTSHKITENKKEETCILIDVAIPADMNVSKRKQKRN